MPFVTMAFDILTSVSRNHLQVEPSLSKTDVGVLQTWCENELSTDLLTHLLQQGSMPPFT